MIVIHLVKLMYLISVCNKTRTQADKIMQLGRKVIIEDKCPELTYELTLLVKILKEERVVFTAHDFFPIDYPLFISFIGAATTYWVIMVQFQLTSPS
ncbi:putative gustatory receptor 28b [Diaphorina citri]|uniref:Gustatory receptor 28b n=1 Tax=Diaphorina citri TaxID=121845 RepID=A0A1S3DU65_DIACI|nr:putative gustatory receptor 28b [Diaphorina citri]